MHENDLPNLFIIGAPKCGTTSMFRWLSAHPEICASDPKETWFFAGHELNHLNIRPNHLQNKLSDYLSCFGPADRFTRVKMEGSTHYLYSAPALNFLSGMSPKPRIIVQLRDPASRIQSHFNYIKQQAAKPIQISFSDYVDAILTTDIKSNNVFTHEPWPQHLLENQLLYSNYHQHLCTWLECFSQDCVKILILEDLVKQKRNTMQDVAEWVGVDPAYYDRFEFGTENVTRSRTFRIIRKHVRQYTRFLPKSVTAASGQVVEKTLESFRSRSPKADQAALAKIRDFYIRPNQRLHSEFGLDLSGWSR